MSKQELSTCSDCVGKYYYYFPLSTGKKHLVSRVFPWPWLAQGGSTYHFITTDRFPSIPILSSPPPFPTANLSSRLPALLLARRAASPSCLRTLSQDWPAPSASALVARTSQDCPPGHQWITVALKFSDFPITHKAGNLSDYKETLVVMFRFCFSELNRKQGVQHPSKYWKNTNLLKSFFLRLTELKEKIYKQTGTFLSIHKVSRKEQAAFFRLQSNFEDAV